MEEQKRSRILRLPEVMHITGLSRSTIYTYLQNKLFPLPVRIGVRAIGWPESQILDWVDRRISGVHHDHSKKGG